MDELDLAADRSELERESILRRIMARKPESLEPVGECYACGELVSGYKLFCNNDCASEHARRKR